MRKVYHAGEPLPYSVFDPETGELLFDPETGKTLTFYVKDWQDVPTDSGGTIRSMEFDRRTVKTTAKRGHTTWSREDIEKEVAAVRARYLKEHRRPPKDTELAPAIGVTPRTLRNYRNNFGYDV